MFLTALKWAVSAVSFNQLQVGAFLSPLDPSFRVCTALGPWGSDGPFGLAPNLVPNMEFKFFS